MGGVEKQDKRDLRQEVKETVKDIKNSLKSLEEDLAFLDDIANNKKSKILEKTVDNYRSKIKEIKKEMRSAKRHKELSYLKAKQDTIVNLWNLIEELKDITAKEKQLSSNEKYQSKQFKENVKNNRLMVELSFLNAFNSASEKFQSDMKEIISGKRDANFVLSVYTNPDYKQYLDDIYFQSEQIPELHGELRSIYNNSNIYANQWGYVYQIPGGNNKYNKSWNTKETSSTGKTTLGWLMKDKFNQWGNWFYESLKKSGAPEPMAAWLWILTKAVPLGATVFLTWKAIKSAYDLVFKSTDDKWFSLWKFWGNLAKVTWWWFSLAALFWDIDKLGESAGFDVKEYFSFPWEDGKPVDFSKQENLLTAALSDQCPEEKKQQIVYPMLGMSTTMGLTYAQLQSASTFDANGKIKSVDYNKLQKVLDDTWKKDNPTIWKKISARIKDAQKLKEKKGIDIVAHTMDDITKKELEDNPTGTTAEYFAQKIWEDLKKWEDVMRTTVIDNLFISTEKWKLNRLLDDKKDDIIETIIDEDKYFDKFQSGERKLTIENDEIIMIDEEKGKCLFDINAKDPFEKLESWEDLDDKVTIKDYLNTIKDMKLSEKVEIVKAMNMLHDVVDDDQKSALKLHIDASGNIAWLSSYGQILNFDYKNKKIPWLDIQFENIEELFKTANLINKLKDVVKTKNPDHNWNDPFKKTWGNSLNFDDEDSPRYNTLTLLKNYKWRNNSGDIAKWLWGSKWMEELTAYMNTWRNREKDIYTNQPQYIKDKQVFFDTLSLDNNGDSVAMFDAINNVYEKLPNPTSSKQKAMKIDKINGLDKIKLTTYGQETILDYKAKKIEGLNVVLKNFDELFLTANLINRVKDIAITKTPWINPDGSWDDRNSPFSLGKSNSLEFRSITDPWYNELTILGNYRPFYHSTKLTASALGTTEWMKKFTGYMNTWWNDYVRKKYWQNT